MKKIDFGQTIGILANIGVIAGILFLAFELRQNNQLLQADQREARNQRLQSRTTDIYDSPDLAELLVKARNGESLSEGEALRLHSFQIRGFRGFEAQWREFVAGTTDFLPLDQFRRIFQQGGFYRVPMSESWEFDKPFLPEDFVQWMEENVVNER